MISLATAIVSLTLLSIIIYFLGKWYYQENLDPRNFLKKDEIQNFFGDQSQNDNSSQQSLPVSITVINIGNTLVDNDSINYELNQNFDQ